MKRSQMEILGLAVVFILLIFGLLIYLRLSVNDEGSKDDFVQPKLSASVLNSMLKTSVRCDVNTVYSITDLLKDCADRGLRRISDCPLNDPSLIDQYKGNKFDNNDNLISCPLADHMLNVMLNETLRKYQLPTYLNIKVDAIEFLTINSTYNVNGRPRDCKIDTTQREPAVQPFELSVDTLIIQFGICY